MTEMMPSLQEFAFAQYTETLFDNEIDMWALTRYPEYMVKQIYIDFRYGKDLERYKKTKWLHDELYVPWYRLIHRQFACIKPCLVTASMTKAYIERYPHQLTQWDMKHLTPILEFV